LHKEGNAVSGDTHRPDRHEDFPFRRRGSETVVQFSTASIACGMLSTVTGDLAVLLLLIHIGV